MSFHWSCFIVPSCLEIVHLLSYWFVSHCFIQSMRKKKKKKKKRRKKKRKEKIYINKCARICIQYKYSLSSYVDL